jgi:cytochrome c553
MCNRTTEMLRNLTVLFLLGLVISIGGCSKKQKTKPEAKRPTPRKELAPLPDSLLILAGKQLFESPALGSADRSCASCHVGGEDLRGVADSYPKFSELAAKEITLIEMNNICIAGALKGKPLDPESDAAQALAAYIRNLK